jgi:hypothetical protein
MKDRAAAAAFHLAFRTLRDQPAPGAALAVVPGVRRMPSFGTVAAKATMSAVAAGESGGADADDRVRGLRSK